MSVDAAAHALLWALCAETVPVGPRNRSGVIAFCNGELWPGLLEWLDTIFRLRFGLCAPLRKDAGPVVVRLGLTSPINQPWRLWLQLTRESGLKLFGIPLEGPAPAVQQMVERSISHNEAFEAAKLLVRAPTSTWMACGHPNIDSSLHQCRDRIAQFQLMHWLLVYLALLGCDNRILQPLAIQLKSV
jgi:hypothetical protein